MVRLILNVIGRIILEKIMKHQKIKLIAFILAFVAQFASAPLAAADVIPLKVNAADTVAGYASLLTAPMLNAGKEVVFVVEKPDSSVIRIPAEADLDGVARADLYGHQTKQAGVYKVALYYPGTTDATPQNTFAVYPDVVSPTQSMIQATHPMVEADGLDQTFVTVTLFDAYRNPIQDHQVNLISSDSNVTVEPINSGVSDENGRASFEISSRYTGVSVFTPMDTSANVVLSDRAEIVFHAPTRSDREVGGNSLTLNGLMANASQDLNVLPGPVDHFEVEGLPSSLKVNTDQTLTIVAKDKDNNVAKNYTGTILISTPNDENAVLPNNGEYTFKESDQGQFTFNLALRFTQTGNQTIQILDKDDWTISGEYEVNVTSGQAINVPTDDSLVIKSPLDGATFGTGSVVITGQGDPNINLKIFGDDIKIADTETDTDGFFTYQVQNLSGGSHTFYVMSEQGQVSDAVTITVDTLPPLLSDFQISPSGLVSPSESLSVSLTAEPGLTQATLRFQGVEKTLLPQQGQSGVYAGVVTAPAAAGTYPVDLILVDDLGNTSEFLGQASIQVQESSLILPPQVRSLQAVSSATGVDLTWDPIMNHTDAIATYKVYYGTNFNRLDQVAQTTDSTPALTVSNLTTATQYFFAVTAVDVKGNESGQKSPVIAISTTGGMDELDAFMPDDTLINADNVADFDLFESISNQDSMMPVATSGNQQLMGTPSSGMMTLSWQPFAGVTAANYKVYFGLTSGQYDDYLIVPGHQTTAVVQDLIDEVPYYFAVVALDAQGNEISPLSAEFQGIPSGTVFHTASGDQITSSQPTYESPLSNFQLSRVPSQEETGAAVWWLVSLSILFASGFYFYGRKRLI